MTMDSDYRVKPCAGRVAVRPLDEPEMSSGGLHLVRTVSSDAKPVAGMVIAVCDEYILDQTPMYPLFDVGDLVVIGRHSGSEVKIGRLTVIIVREQDVLCELIPGGNEDDGTSA